MFDLLDKQLKKHGLSWQNGSAFYADNAILDQQKRFSAFVPKSNDKLFIHSCVCHLIYLTELHAARELISIII